MAPSFLQEVLSVNVAKLVVYEKDLPNEGGLVLKDFKCRLEGSLVSFSAGEVIRASVLEGIMGTRSRLPIRDLSLDPPTKSKKPIIIGEEAKMETHFSEDLPKTEPETKPEAPEEVPPAKPEE